MFDSFLKYQSLVQQIFMRLHATYGFTIVDGHRSVEEINAELRARTEAVLAS